MSPNRLLPILLSLPLLLVAGCIGYQFGTSLPNNYKSICVKPFDNKTGEPNLQFAATTAVLREFQIDGSLSLTDADTADLILETTLKEAKFTAVRFSKKRTQTASEYRMTVQSVISLTDRKTGAVLISKKKVQGESSFTSVGDSQQARLSAQPHVSADLAHQIVKNVVEFW
jgi:hypothetical protein